MANCELRIARECKSTLCHPRHKVSCEVKRSGHYRIVILDLLQDLCWGG